MYRTYILFGRDGCVCVVWFLKATVSVFRLTLRHTGSALYWTPWVLLSSNHDHIRPLKFALM